MAKSNRLTFTLDADSSLAAAEVQKLWADVERGSTTAAFQLEKALGGSTTKVIELDYKTSDSGVTEVTAQERTRFKVLDQIFNKKKQVQELDTNSVTSLRQQVNQARQARDAISKIATVTDQAAGTVAGKLNPQWVEANNRVNELNLKLARTNGNILDIAKAKFPIIGQALSLGNSFLQIAQIATLAVQGIMAINQATQQFIVRAKQIAGLKLALGAYAVSEQEVQGVLMSSKAIALEYGGSLTQIEKAYKRIAPAILASGGSMQDVEVIIESLVAKTAQLGLNTEQSGRYIEAFAQVMGKGKLQSEELNQQFSELDGALRSQIALYLDTKYGITDITEAMKNGEVTAQIFREGFVEAARSAREELAGAIGAVNSRLNELNPQQIENIRDTLNTITIEKLAGQFDDFGKIMQNIANDFTQFGLAVATQLPNLSELVVVLINAVGRLLQVVIKFTLLAVQGLLKVVDIIVLVIDKFTGLQRAAQATAGFFNWLGQFFQEAADKSAMLGVNMEVLKSQFGELGASQIVLQTAFESGQISAEEYKKGLERLYQKGTEQSKIYKDALDAEIAKLDELAEQAKRVYEEKKEEIQKVIDKQEEALTKEKDGLKETLEQYKEVYDERKKKIDEEIDKIKERYDLELKDADELTFAEKEQLRLRREKLQATIDSTDATYEEKINAQASLDAMNRQVEKARIKEEREKALNAEKKKGADAEKKYEADKKKAEDESKARQDQIKQSISEQKSILEALTQEYKNTKKAIDEAKNLTQDQSDDLTEINGKINNQIGLVNQAKDKYWEAARANQEISRQLLQQERILRRMPKGRANRFAGGPVVGGRQYTVNELGKEGFLSSSGKLSAINAPAWGTWTAPGSGTVVPADIFAVLQATTAPSGVSMAGMNASRATGNQDIIRALLGISNGGNVQNNVTVQAVNPTQAASDMLVSLTRIKRRRYG